MPHKHVCFSMLSICDALFSGCLIPCPFIIRCLWIFIFLFLEFQFFQYGIEQFWDNCSLRIVFKWSYELLNHLLKLLCFTWTEHFLNGYLTESTLLWSEGRSDWQALSSIPELMSQIYDEMGT